VTFSQCNVNDLLIVFIGVLLLFRTLAQMERHHTLRVFLMTALLSCGVIFFLLMYGFTLGSPVTVQDCSDPQQFCLTDEAVDWAFVKRCDCRVTTSEAGRTSAHFISILTSVINTASRNSVPRKHSNKQILLSNHRWNSWSWLPTTAGYTDLLRLFEFTASPKAAAASIALIFQKIALAFLWSTNFK